MKKIVSILVILALLLSLSSCMLFKSEMKDLTDSWVRQEDDAVAIVTRDDTIEIDGRIINLEDYLDGLRVGAYRFLAVIGEEALLYGLKEFFDDDAEYRARANVFAVNLTTLELRYIYQEYCSPNDESLYLDGYKYEPDVCYRNRTVIIYDGVMRVHINIDTGRAEKVPVDFEYPTEEYIVKRNYYGRYDKMDYSKLIIIHNGEERILTIDYMVERHEYIKAIDDIYKSNRRKYRKMFDDFYTDNESLVIGDKIYFVCSFIEADGGKNGMMFSYNYVTDEFTYLYHHYCYGNAYHYAVPVEAPI